MLFPHELSGLFFPSGARSVSSGQKLLLLVRRSPLNAACQLLRWSPLAVVPVSRHFAAAFAALSFAPGLLSCAAACGWRLEAGPGWVGLRSKLSMSFALKNLRLEIFEP